jgi:hypothetical protein
MKKTALTFRLFSLVMVATSFASPQQFDNNDTAQNERTEIELSQPSIINPSDGQIVGRNKKIDDLYAVAEKQSNVIDGSIIGHNKKLD